MMPDDVLAMLIDVTRLAGSGAPAEIAAISSATTVRTWMHAFETHDWRATAEWLNEIFDISIELDQWHRALHPTRQRTLRDVCQLIAAHAVGPRVEPILVFGQHCSAAATFLSVREVLHRNGADTADLRPSSMLEPYLNNLRGNSFWQLARLAPGRLPPMVSAGLSASELCAIGVFAGWCVWLMGLVLRNSQYRLAGGLCEIAFILGAWTIGRMKRLNRVRFVNLRTFKDLCLVMTGERSPTGPAFPVDVARKSIR
jgi:hypothetical protein